MWIPLNVHTKCNLEVRRKVQKKYMRKKKHEKTKKIKFLMQASALNRKLYTSKLRCYKLSYLLR